MSESRTSNPGDPAFNASDDIKGPDHDGEHNAIKAPNERFGRLDWEVVLLQETSRCIRCGVEGHRSDAEDAPCKAEKPTPSSGIECLNAMRPLLNHSSKEYFQKKNIIPKISVPPLRAQLMASHLEEMRSVADAISFCHMRGFVDLAIIGASDFVDLRNFSKVHRANGLVRFVALSGIRWGPTSATSSPLTLVLHWRCGTLVWAYRQDSLSR